MSTENKAKRSSFTGTLGFIMAAAGSAVGLGNIWRFPYLAAKDNGGVFILVYVILAVTFGFTLLTTEIAIGRKTAQSPLTAYGLIHPKFKWVGVPACLVPVIILPYYCTIGGWVVKYLTVFITGKGAEAAKDGYFTGYITQNVFPVIFMAVFLGLTAFVVFSGVNKGIEKYNKVLMPALLVLIAGISVYSLTLKFTDESGFTRTGLEGLKIYLIPDFSGMTVGDFAAVITDALGQLFFSISVAMGIMVTYGSYVKKDANLMKSINQIEIFDTIVALLAGMMIVPAVFTFMGEEGMSAGPGLMFVSLPKVFEEMGTAGNVIGSLFFIMVLFAAVTSSVSVMEAIVSSIMDKFGLTRKKSAAIVTAYALVGGIIVCLGYNLLYFEVTLPNGTVAQVLDIMDYISNNCLMPLVALLTCILIGWVTGSKVIIDEVTSGGVKFGRKTLYVVMIKFIAPILLFLLLLQSVGILKISG
ncbi:MAG: sodium-dependent transporter [Oscillospiraceae bacterium]|nr:sodium-dependent transporter [Oscillospiraceae bacterium]